LLSVDLGPLQTFPSDDILLPLLASNVFPNPIRRFDSMRPFTHACATAIVAVAPVFYSPLQAQDWLREAIAPEDRMHDFGTVARAANTEHRFVIKNNSNSDLHLRSVRASCGCTTPIIETEWIKPGQTGSVLARFNTGTFTGRKSATLTVSIDKPFYTELQLNVKGYIRSDIVLNPGEISFGEVPVGEPQSREVTLDYAGRSDWQVVGIDNPTDFLQVDFQETSRSAGRVSYKITAALSPDAPVGNLQNQILLRTNDRNLTTVPVRLLATVQPPIQISPQAVALGTLPPGEPVSQRLVIKGKREFRILEITSEHAEIRFDPIESAKPAHVVNVGIVPRPQAKDGTVKSEILVKTDLTDQPLRIPLTFSQLSQAAVSSVVQID